MATDLMERLKELIAIELDNCNKIDWPYVCHMASNPETRKSIEGMIIEYCTTSKTTIGEAMEKIERAFNPNKMED